MNQSNNKTIIKKNELYREAIVKAKNNSQLYKALSLRHEFLKHLQDRVGKGGAYQDESAEEME